MAATFAQYEITTIPRSIVLASVAGRNNYRIPVGDWVLDAAGTSTLEIDSGAGSFSRRTVRTTRFCGA